MAKRGRPSKADLALRAAQSAADHGNVSDAARLLRAQRAAQADDASAGAKDVSTDTEDALTRPKITRDSYHARGMADLLAARSESRESPSDTDDSLTTQAEIPPSADPTESESVGSSTTEAPAAEPAVAEPVSTAAPATLVKVKIDGVESEVPETEIEPYGGVRGYQIAKALENRLEKATSAVAEARATQAQAAQVLQQMAQLPQSSSGPSAQQQALDLLDVMRFGTPEEGVNALFKMVNPDQITQRAVQAVLRQNAVEHFRGEFSDVVANPLALKLAMTLEADAERAARGPIDWKNLYSSIGNQVRSAFALSRQDQSSAVAAPETPSSPSSADREQRKAAAIVTLPTAAQRASLPNEPKPATREDVLNAMRKSRGFRTD